MWIRVLNENNLKIILCLDSHVIYWTHTYWKIILWETPSQVSNVIDLTMTSIWTKAITCKYPVLTHPDVLYSQTKCRIYKILWRLKRKTLHSSWNPLNHISLISCKKKGIILSSSNPETLIFYLTNRISQKVKTANNRPSHQPTHRTMHYPYAVSINLN